MKDAVRLKVKLKLAEIKRLTKEIDNLINKGDKFVIRAASGNKLGMVDIYDPINDTTNLIGLFEREEDFGNHFKNISRGIFQAIKYIPLTAVKPGCFELRISHIDDWESIEITDEEIGEEAAELRKNMLSIFDQYGVKPTLLLMDEVDEMEDEYDIIYNNRECSES